MKASPKYAWFKPLLALILFGVFYGLFALILSVVQTLFGYDALGLDEVVGAVANNVTAMAMSTIFVSATVTKTTAIGSFFFDITSTLVTAAVAYHPCKRLGYLKEK